jgi:tetratricopeptide (TPR) repeat protein
MYRVVVLFLASIIASGQSSRSPQEIVKEAEAAQQAGNFDLAIQDYRLILASYPSIAELRSNLGAALAAQGHYSEAIVEYKRALQAKPGPQVRLNLALAYYKIGDLTEAVPLLKKVYSETPNNPQVLTLLADCYLRLGQNKNVIELLSPRQSNNAGDLAEAYLLGTALVRDGQPEKGQVIIDRILKNGDTAEARLLMGTTKYMVKDFSGALVDLQKAVELNHDLPDVNAYYGLAMLSTGDQAGARKAFERELQVDPNNFDSNLRLGVVARQDQDNALARKYFDHALQIRPGDPGVRYQIAALELAEGKLENAQKDLESLTKDSPDFLEAHVSLATVYFREKRKADGDRERQTVARLNAARAQATEIAAKPRSE